MDQGAVQGTLVRRMRVTSGLTEDELAVICDLPIVVRRFSPDQHVVHDGDRPTDCCLIVHGFGRRSKTTASGQRQILSLHVPGDIPDLQSLHLQVMDHDLVTLTECTLGFISHASLRDLHRKPRKNFHYFNKGDLAVIGRSRAIADLGWIRFGGRIAWFFWLFVHIMYLVGFRNRAVVFMDWALAYVRYDRSARLITDRHER